MNSTKSTSITVLPAAALLRAVMPGIPLRERMMNTMAETKEINKYTLDQLIVRAESVPLEDEHIIGYYFNQLSLLTMNDYLAMFTEPSVVHEKVDHILETLGLADNRDTVTFGDIMIRADIFLVRAKKEEEVLRMIEDLDFFIVIFHHMISEDKKIPFNSISKETMFSIPLFAPKSILKRYKIERPDSDFEKYLTRNSFIKEFIKDKDTLGKLISAAYDLAQRRIDLLNGNEDRASVPPLSGVATNAAYNLTKHFLINPVRIYAEKHRHGEEDPFWISEE